MAFNKGGAFGGAMGGQAVAGPTGALAGYYGGKDLDLAGGLSGTGKNAGILGVGQYKAGIYDADRAAFEKQVQLDPFVQAQQATINQGPQDQFRGRQMSLADALQAQSMGQGPSLAQLQLRQGTDRNIAQAMALGASQRGGSPGLAQRQIAQQTAAANQQAAMQAAQTRMAEQLAAREQLGGVLQGGRGQDIGLATSQAQLDQERNLANAQAQNAYNMNKASVAAANQKNLMDYQKLMADQYSSANAANQAAYADASKRRGEMVSNVGTAIASMASDRKLKKNISSYSMSDEDQKKDVKSYHPDSAGTESLKSAFKTPPPKEKKKKEAEEKYPGLAPSISDALGKFASAYSDEEGKDHVKQVAPPAPAEDSDSKNPLKSIMSMVKGSGASSSGLSGLMSSDEEAKDHLKSPGKLQSFLDALKAYEYEYKEPEKFGYGKHISPMAQDIEKSELGKPGVVETSEGKMVDYGKLGGVMLASQALMNDRLNDLEEALKNRRK